VAERTAELQASNEDLGSFSYSVAHDLRAPLRAIDGYSYLVRTEHAAGLGAEGQRMLNVVGGEAKRMGRLIDDLLAFSRMGRHEAKAAPVDMTALARATFENVVRLAAPATKVSFELQDLPPALGDASLLTQVWFNLLDNAVKYSSRSPAPVIAVDGWREGGASTYRVRDNGVGFNDRFRDKLFGAFQRLHTGDEFDGTGLGLALVKRIVQRHGGSVGAEGRLGEGATFSFTVPDRKLR
jgi:light-regulated signal transduction histidine kinase (bacteriophytochrome)